MLGKLLKYELEGTARYFLPLFLGVLVFSLLIRIFGSMFAGGSELIIGLMIFIEVILITALVVMVMVITIQRFYKNLLGTEGYLMFTLPVSTHHNILSKLLAATIWNIAAALMIGLSIVIMVWNEGSVAEIFGFLWQQFATAVQLEMGLSPLLMLGEWGIMALLAVACNILFLYLAMAIGQLTNEHKFLASFGAYVGLTIGEGILFTIIGQILSHLPHSWFRGLSVWLESLSTAAGVQLGTLFMTLGIIIVGAIYYFFTHRLLHKKLNLT